MAIPDTRIDPLPYLTYGHLYGENTDLLHLQGTGRSGLSPAFYSGPHEALFPPQGTEPLFEAERIYQRTKLAGYTSSTLHAMGALVKPDVKIPNLVNEVHPIFDKPMWAPIGTVPLDHGLEGSYVVHNDLVWNALLPSLRLASKFLENAHCWPWWDALLYGKRKYVPSPPATKVNVMRTFHLRPPYVVAAEGFTADESFVERFKKRIRYLINIANSSWDNPRTGKITHCSTMGYTQYLPQWNLARVTFASQMISPLLRDDLSDSQRLVIQFQTAKTILHEFAHALGFVLDQDIGHPSKYGEPFFEEQIIAELGESMETALCGGRMWSWPSNLRESAGRAFMMTAVQNWPNFSVMSEKFSLGLGHQLFPGSGNTFGPGCTSDITAIPISWMESLFQEDFWAVYVRQFGADAVKPYPKLITQGSVIVSVDPQTHEAKCRSVTLFGADWDAYFQARTAPEVEMGGSVMQSLAHRMDAERVQQAYRQCAVLEQAMSWYWARTGIFEPET